MKSTIIYEMQTQLWVDTPDGEGVVILVMNQGSPDNNIWVVANEKTRQIAHYNSSQVKLCWNHAMFENLFKDRL